MDFESLEQNHDTFNLHKQIQAITERRNSRGNDSIQDKHNNLLFEKERILQDYMEELKSS